MAIKSMADAEKTIEERPWNSSISISTDLIGRWIGFLKSEIPNITSGKRIGRNRRRKINDFDQMNIQVQQIPAKEAEPWLLLRHYAKRKCPISYAFGAYANGNLIGVVTYGTPSSSPLREGIAGKKWANQVLELNRLCCETIKNLASFLVGRSLRMLPRPTIVVSYADTQQGHIGYIYQASNFLYTGLSAKRTDWKIKGKEHLHGATIADESRGQTNRAEWMRKKYGDDFYLENRPRKHRYIYLCGDKRQKKAMRDALRYNQEPFPKGETQRYDASATINTQSILF